MPFLELENQEEIINNAKSGCQDSINMIFDTYYCIVHSIAKSYFLIGSDSDDLIQEGMIGLYKAVLDYQIDKGLTFKRFAELCIKRHIFTAIKSYNRIKHIPLNSYKSIYEPIYEGGTISLSERLASMYDDPETSLLQNELFEDLRTFINSVLSKREKAVLLLYLYGLSYKEIASTLHISYKSTDCTIWRVKNKLRKSKLSSL